MVTHKYRCPSCNGTNLAPVGRDPRNKSPTAKNTDQIVYQCGDCTRKVGELTLERERRKAALQD